MNSESLSDEQTCEFYVDMLNNYLEYYKKTNGKPDELTIIDGINVNDKYSTNPQLSIFYEEMVKYKNMSEENRQLYKYNELENLKSADELFGIFSNEKSEPIVVSKSLYSLIIEITNLKNESPKNRYEIISMI
jgi:hypothetical protein